MLVSRLTTYEQDQLFNHWCDQENVCQFLGKLLLRLCPLALKFKGWEVEGVKEEQLSIIPWLDELIDWFWMVILDIGSDSTELTGAGNKEINAEELEAESDWLLTEFEFEFELTPLGGWIIKSLFDRIVITVLIENGLEDLSHEELLLITW